MQRVCENVYHQGEVLVLETMATRDCRPLVTRLVDHTRAVDTDAG